MKKKTTLFLIVSIFLIFTITACGRECNCNCNCNVSITDNEVEETPEPTPETMSDSEETEIELEQKEEDESEEEYNYEEDDADEPTLEQQRKVYDQAKKLYLSGKWDGNPMTLQSQIVSLDESGDIFVNDEQVEGYSRYVDLPDDFDCEDVDSRYEYIPGQGVYAIKDKILIKYVKGKKVSLKGGTLKVNGSLKVGELEDAGLPYLFWEENSKELILITGNLDSNTYYLYVFPDYNISKVKYVAEITDWNISGYASSSSNSQEFHLYYKDLKGVKWIWSKKGPEIYEKKSK